VGVDSLGVGGRDAIESRSGCATLPVRKWRSDSSGTRRKRVESQAACISSEEAVGVFGDPLARIFDDEDFAVGERREIIIGHSTRNRLLLICFIERGDVIRIISARKATRNERKDYEEGITP